MAIKRLNEVVTQIKSEGRISIQFTVVAMGQDLCIAVSGGDRPHLGALALAQCRPSLADPAQVSASVSVLTLLGHKEDQLASVLANQISKLLGTNVAVLCGIHIDDISSADFATVQRMTEQWCQEYLACNARRF